MKSALTILLSIPFLLAGSLTAGTPETAVDPAPVCEVPFYGSVGVGYDTAYLFRGGNYGDHAPWAEIDLNYDLSDNLSLNIGTWYTNVIKNPVVSDELDLYAYLSSSVECPLTGAWDVSVGGTWFYFAEDGGDETEVNLILTKSIGDLFDFTFDYVYDITYRAHYFGYYADKSVPLTNCLDLELGTGISHADDNYNFIIVGGDHAYARAGLVWHMTESADLSGYVLGNFPYNDLKDAGEEEGVYGGASLSVSF